ncbi:hypothetical protein CYMTET_9542 [Cymbomonas tetramitiformis]|uniref:Sphingomyelin phosphodiesterase 4 n=1 Tax=Cymbomonas tetramitiformis TaxID=36881 RepID=A0AAE0LEX5_9CHLO|nr:hypothetical protein CYMTET_9542 [Cymbomonas tetramitiformis]
MQEQNPDLVADADISQTLARCGIAEARSTLNTLLCDRNSCLSFRDTFDIFQTIVLRTFAEEHSWIDAAQRGGEYAQAWLLGLFLPNETLMQRVKIADQQQDYTNRDYFGNTTTEQWECVFPSSYLPERIKHMLLSSHGVVQLDNLSHFKGRLTPLAQHHVLATEYQLRVGLYEFFMFALASYCVRVVKPERYTPITSSQYPIGNILDYFEEVDFVGPWKVPRPPPPRLHEEILLQHLHATCPGIAACANLAEPSPGGVKEDDNPQGDLFLNILLDFWLSDPSDFRQKFPVDSPAAIGAFGYSSRPLPESLVESIQLLVKFILSPSPPSRGEALGGLGAAARHFFVQGSFSPEDRASALSFSSATPQPFSTLPTLHTQSWQHRQSWQALQVPTKLNLKILQEMKAPLYSFFRREFTSATSGRQSREIVKLWLTYLAPWAHDKPFPKPVRRQQQYPGEQLPVPQQEQHRPARSSRVFTPAWSWHVRGNALFYGRLMHHFLEKVCNDGDDTYVGEVLSELVVFFEREAKRPVETGSSGGTAKLLTDLLEEMDTSLSRVAQTLRDRSQAPGTPQARQPPGVQDPQEFDFYMKLTWELESMEFLELPADLTPRGLGHDQVERSSFWLDPTRHEETKKLVDKLVTTRLVNPQQHKLRKSLQKIFDLQTGTSPDPGPTPTANDGTLLEGKGGVCPYDGDWMRRPIGGNEVDFLVRDLIAISEKINRLLRCTPLSKFGDNLLNLRWLAEKPLLVCISPFVCIALLAHFWLTLCLLLFLGATIHGSAALCRRRS